eukprot:gene23846-biopygen19366
MWTPRAPGGGGGPSGGLTPPPLPPPRTGPGELTLPPFPSKCRALGRQRPPFHPKRRSTCGKKSATATRTRGRGGSAPVTIKDDVCGGALPPRQRLNVELVLAFGAGNCHQRGPRNLPQGYGPEGYKKLCEHRELNPIAVANWAPKDATGPRLGRRWRAGPQNRTLGPVCAEGWDRDPKRPGCAAAVRARVRACVRACAQSIVLASDARGVP